MRLLMWTLLSFAASCGVPAVGDQGSLVGKSCSLTADCDKLCYLSDRHFPGGLCTLRCASDADCPAGALCIKAEINICAIACLDNNICAAAGRGFVCDAVPRVGTAGDSLVCRVP